MRRAVIRVRDKMQANYRYELTEPEGQNFDAEFRPQLTPPELLCLGIFGGKYMTDCPGEFLPIGLLARSYLVIAAILSSTFSGLMPVSLFPSGAPTGGFTPTIPAVGFNGIAATTVVAAWKMIGGRSSGGRRCAAIFVRSSATARGETSSVRQRQALLHWAYDSRVI